MSADITREERLTLQPATTRLLTNSSAGFSAACQVSFGNCGGIIASFIYITGQAPAYPVGFAVSLAFIWVCGFAATAMLLLLMSENKKRNAGKRDNRLSLPQKEIDNLGDDHPKFRFSY